MKTSMFKKISFAFLLVSFGIVSTAKAGIPGTQGDHPYYLHALSDLRAARWMIEHRPGNWEQTMDEIEAVKQIDAAIKEIRTAAIEDGKDINDHPKADEHPDHMGRLHDALAFLCKARKDISHDEDNQFAEGLQGRAYLHIDAAINATKRAVNQ
jgi:hypothetical protein